MLQFADVPFVIGAVFTALLLLGLVESDDDDLAAALVGVLAEDLRSEERVTAGEQADVAAVDQVR
ncbi:hypothetical protein D3C85_1889570 [compost metagenome]